jgi:hypothetical protein
VQIHGVEYRFENVVQITLDRYPPRHRPHEVRGSAATNACSGA